MKKIGDLRLSTKILIPSILLTSIIFLIFVRVLIVDQRKKTEAELAKKSERIISLLMYSTVDSIWNLDYDNVDKIFDAFFLDRDISKIVLYDEKGAVLTSKNRHVSGSRNITKSEDIVKDRYIYGKIEVTFTNYFFEEEIKSIQYRLIVFAAIVYSMFALVITGVSRIALRPLRLLMTGINHIGKGQYDHKVEKISNDELGKLTSEFNNMADKILDLQTAAVSNARIETELEIAKNIQTTLLPEISKFNGLTYDISAKMLPASEVGGDYYDVIYDQKDNLWFGMGDVTGHGLEAGLIMMMVQVAANSLLGSNCDITPADLLTRVNNVLYLNIREGLKEDHHMTLCFFKEIGAGEFQYAGAHEEVLIYRYNHKVVEQVKTRGMWLGIIPEITKQTTAGAGYLTLERGDVLLLYTDGVTELMNDNREMFSVKRLKSFLTSHAHDNSVEQLDQLLFSTLQTYSNKQKDDITYMFLKFPEES